MSKQHLVKQLEAHLESELEALRASAQAAADAATHEDAKPENKYDTRGLEASYLAGAQAERVAELQAAVTSLKAMVARDFGDGDPIGVSALVEVEAEGTRTLCFLVRHGAGYKLDHESRTVVTVTTSSPLGKALLGKTVGDVVTIPTAQGERDYDVTWTS